MMGYFPEGEWVPLVYLGFLNCFLIIICFSLLLLTQFLSRGKVEVIKRAKGCKGELG